MKEPYAVPPAPTGSAEGDRGALSEWLLEADRISPSDYAHTVPCKNGNTVALLRLGALGPRGLLLGYDLSGEYDPGSVLMLARERVRRRLEFRRQFGSGETLENEFEVYGNSFAGCRVVDDYIGVIINAHAAPASSKLVSLLVFSPGRPRPPTLDP